MNSAWRVREDFLEEDSRCVMKDGKVFSRKLARGIFSKNKIMGKFMKPHHMHTSSPLINVAVLQGFHFKVGLEGSREVKRDLSEVTK